MMDELRRLNNAFGIGVIRLEAEHFMQSEILFSAKEKESLDWIPSTGWWMTTGIFRISSMI